VLRVLAARDPQRYPLLLESAASGPLSRASVLLAEPAAALWLDADGRLGAAGMTPVGPDFLTALENWWQAERYAPGAREELELPFTGGWALFLGYELAQEIEPKLALPRAPLPWQAFALRTRCALVHDLARARVYAVAEEGAAPALDRIVAQARAVAHAPPAADTLRVERVRQGVRACRRHLPGEPVAMVGGRCRRQRGRRAARDRQPPELCRGPL
jgi:anthranilate synthase component 1